MLEKYAKVREELLNFSSEVEKSNYIDKAIIESNDLLSSKKELEKNAFKVALVSTFSSGKSTFINALIGADILSMDERAWTATVTRVMYDTNISLEIIYNNGDKDVISGIYKGKKLTTASVDIIKGLIEEKTTVQGNGEETKVKEVILRYPFELCKNGIEIIDTPGLNARHESHDNITNSILPNVNAVIFLFEPFQIGNRTFTKKIKEYVQEAANSKRNKENDHIFLIMNKADLVNPKAKVPVLLDEIKDVMQGIITQPKPYPISSYYALKARMVKNGFTQMDEIQEDMNIKIIDRATKKPIIGPLITENHIGDIIVDSNILNIEDMLSKYLEDKGDIFVKNLEVTLKTILESNIKHLQIEKNRLLKISAEQEEEFNEQLIKLKMVIEELRANVIVEMNNYITVTIKGSSKGKGINNKIADQTDLLYDNIQFETENDLENQWEEEKQCITKEDASEVVWNLINEAISALNIHAKEFVKNIFLEIENEALNMVKGIDSMYKNMLLKIDDSIKKTLGESLSSSAESRMRRLNSIIESTIEKEFSSILSDIANNVKEQVEGLVDGSYYKGKKSGLIGGGGRAVNSIVNFFGFGDVVSEKYTYETKFDYDKMISQIDTLIKEIKEECSESLVEKKAIINRKVLDALNEINNSISKEAISMIENEIKLKQGMLDKLLINHKEDKETRKKRLENIERQISKSKQSFMHLCGISKLIQ